MASKGQNSKKIMYSVDDILTITKHLKFKPYSFILFDTFPYLCTCILV